MNRMQEWLSRAADELGLRIEIGYKIKLSDGRTLVSQAYFPDLSNPQGILIFDWPDAVDASARRELKGMGLGATIFGEPSPKEEFDVGSYKEMFSEWGWTGRPGEKPSWMNR